jgi:hypothetical protein
MDRPLTCSPATPVLYSWVAANFAGHTKKVTMNALLLMYKTLLNKLQIKADVFDAGLFVLEISLVRF